MRIIAAVIGFALIVTASAVTNQSLIRARMGELDILLEELSATEDATRSIGIVVRFELIKRRLRLGEQRVENYELEARLQSLAGAPEQEQPENTGSVSPRSRVARTVFALSRGLVGRDPISPTRSGVMSDLEEAYLWERGRRYERAISVYDRLLAGGLDDRDPVRAVVVLHKAFCLTMSGERDTARALCESLDATDVGDEIATVAGEIIRFIDFMQETKREITGSEVPAFELGRGLYYATDYSASARVLREFLDVRNADPRSAEARYFLARALEELGRTQGSIEEYRRVLLLDPGGPWAQESNRRLVVIGSFYQRDERLREAAKRWLQQMGDSDFTSAVEPYQELAQQDPVAPKEPEAVETGPSHADRGELFVQTEPAGAFVTVNGLELGQSPVFVTDVPFGQAVVEAVSGGLAGKANVTVDRGEIIPVVLSLGSISGSIQIDTRLRGAEVSLNDRKVGGLDAVELRSLSPGSYIILVRGTDSGGRVVYWEDIVEVEAGRTSFVEAP